MADLFSMSFERNRGLLFLMTLFIGCRMTSLIVHHFYRVQLRIKLFFPTWMARQDNDLIMI